MKNQYSDEGDINLINTKKANDFTDWMYDVIKPHLKGNILELGSGIGTYSEKVSKDFKKNTIILSDIDQEYVHSLKKKFYLNKKVIVEKIDLNDRSDLKNINQKINTVFALNVLEHVKNDVEALNNIYDTLEPGGRLIILVPAHKFLYNCIDKALGHYRRYSKGMMKTKVKQTKFRIGKMFYFNFAAIIGWYINGNLLGRSVVNEGAMSLFNKLVPILKFIEKYILFRKFGVSLIVVLKK